MRRKKIAKGQAREWVVLGVSCALGAASLLPGRGALVLDDLPDILRNPAVHGSVIEALTESPFRCVTYLTYWFNIAILDNGAAGLHLTNLLLHILTAIILYLLIGELETGDDNHAAAVCAASFFALNPMMGSSVLYVSARPAILVTLGVLIALKGAISYLRSGRTFHLTLAYIGCAMAMLSKESGIVVPLIMLSIIRVARDKKRWAIVSLPAIAAVLIYVILRASHRIDLGELGESAPGPIEYFLTQLTVLPLYLKRFFWPFNIGLEWDVAIRTTPISGAVLSSGAFILLLVVAGVIIARKRKSTMIYLCFIILSLAIESSFIPLADIAFDHRFYMAGAGLSAFVGLLTAGILARTRKKNILYFLGSAAAICFFILGISRSSNWSDLFGAWREAVRVSPDAFRARYNLGHNLLENDELGVALPQLNAAIRLGGKTPAETAYAFNARGLVYIRQKQLDLAISDFTKASQLAPRYGDAVYHLGVAYMLEGSWDEAVRVLNHAKDLLPPGDSKLKVALRRAVEGQRELRSPVVPDLTPK